MRLIVIALLAFTGGCIATPAVWNDANATHLRPLVFRGFVSAANDHSDGLLVEYEPDTHDGGKGSPHHVVFIPLDVDGQPRPPFAVTEGWLNDAEINALQRVHFNASDYRLGERLLADAKPTAINPVDHQLWQGAELQGNFNAGYIVMNLLPAGTYDRKKMYRIALPSQLPRPSDELLAARARAIVFTPPAVLFDVTAGPFVGFGGYVWWAFINGDNG